MNALKTDIFALIVLYIITVCYRWITLLRLEKSTFRNACTNSTNSGKF